ncbi:endogenous retrovirus group K member 113 Gag polyprotein-like [Peromyscus californicus insignis]|uniref:endogenous retrovirus group K member 113 Gag polyprotein-like n=1 Tax=Peromyscus californicus insignis TaxID=564181 RepID=UPI0022A6F906|nr:endogenous retrovirus group K member 113 Gag polyprotein-like [Peromyscus californicus insignis]
MGQATSSQDLFLSGLKEALKIQGTRVKKKDLKAFFDYIIDTCPWFPQEGTIDEKSWACLGDCLDDYYRTFGLEKVPVTTFSYWKLINDILRVYKYSPDIQELINIGEKIFKEAFRFPSTCPKTPRALSGPPSVCPSVHDLRSMEEGMLTTFKPRNPQESSFAHPHPSVNNLTSNSPLDPTKEASLEKGAARYHNPDCPPCKNLPLTQESLGPFIPPQKSPAVPPSAMSPPYVSPASHFCGPILDELAPPVPDLGSLRRALQARREHVELLRELKTLDKELKDLALEVVAPGPLKPSQKSSKSKSKPQPVLAFPVTRSQTSGDSSEVAAQSGASGGLEDQNEEGEEGEEEEEASPEDPPPGQTYHKLNFRLVEKLKSACAQYGPTAPFTLALVENQSEHWLTPNDWYFLARAALSGGDFVLWKTEFTENCREVAQKNIEQPSSKTWTVKKLLGNPPYDTNAAQAKFPPGLLAQIQKAGVRAWKRLPPKGSATTSLAKTPQGPDEPFSEFVSRLNDAAERLFGPNEHESTFVKHLAFENANPACQEVLRPHKNRADLSEYVRLCSGVGAAHAMGSAIGAALRASQQPGARTCYFCKQPGHFLGNVPRKVTASRP